MTLSPGIAHSCFDLLDLINRRSMSISTLTSSFRQVGVMPLGVVIETAQHLNWVLGDAGGIVALTPAGHRLMSLGSTEERLRQAILDFVDIENPFWVQNATFGRRKVLAFAGVAVEQVFSEAGLVHGVSTDVVEFWDRLSARARGFKEDRLLFIGREGERLSLAYERKRTDSDPIWVSLESNEDGYDVLSIVDVDDSRPLSIEVKATSVGRHASFHVTINEWRRAIAAIEHCFHLWDMSAKPSRLAVLSPDLLKSHVPSDKGDGRWELVRIPFATFDPYFVPFQY